MPICQLQHTWDQSNLAGRWLPSSVPKPQLCRPCPGCHNLVLFKSWCTSGSQGMVLLNNGLCIPITCYRGEKHSHHQKG